MVDLVVQVTGGKGPYRVKFARDGRQDNFRQVIAPDGRLVVPVRNTGSYSIIEVQDTHRCSRKEVSNSVSVSHFPTALAAFQQQWIGMCPGDGPQQASVGVTGKKSPAPWQLAVLRNKRYHTNGPIVNSSLTGGTFVFNTEEVVEGVGEGGKGDTLVDEYHIDNDSFTDARGCLGEVRGVLKVKMNALPSVEVVAGARQSKGGTCEDETATLKFTAGSSPWSVTIQLRGGGSSGGADANTSSNTGNVPVGSTCEISGITARSFSLETLQDIAPQKGAQVGRKAGGSGLRTTCPGTVSGQGFLPAGYHVITSVRGGKDDSASGSRMCQRNDIAVPLVIHQLPRAHMTQLACTHLCKDEVPSAMVSLTQGQPPFTVQLKDQFGNVVEQQINAAAGEFRFDRVRVIHGEVSFDRRNWTMVHLRDANGCGTMMKGESIPTVAIDTTVSGVASHSLSDQVARPRRAKSP